MKPVKQIIPSKPKPCNPAMGLMLAGILLCAMAGPARAVVTLQDVYDEVVSIQTKVNSISTKVTTTIPTAVSNVKTDTTEMIGNLHSGTALLVGDVNTMLTDTVSDIASKASERLAGRDDFLNNPTNGPAQVRNNLVSVLNNLQTIVNTLNDMAGTNGRPLNLTAEIQLVTAAPDVAMFPLSKAFQVVDFPKLAAQLSDAAVTLQTLSAALPDDQCDVIMANQELFEHALTDAKRISLSLKLGGNLIEKEADKIPAEGIGIWGFPKITFKGNHAKDLAELMKSISEGMEKVADIVESHVDSCKQDAYQSEVLSQLSSVRTALSNLNTRISSAASQASVDALAVSLGNVATPLDAAVSTRATQASMDTLTSLAGNQATTALRLQVELQLSDNTRQLSMFYLPEAMGGKLGFVRSVVADTIATNEAASLYSGTLAGEKLQAGDAAAATNDFRDAFDNYRQAYQEVVKWPVTASLQSSAAPSALDLTWPSDPGGIYAVESSSNLVNWSLLMPKVVGAAGQSGARLSASGDHGFYRVSRLSSYDPSPTNFP